VKPKVSPTLNKALGNCPKCAMPGNIAPMAPTLIQEPFNDKEWHFEIKWDGFRMLAYCSGEKVNLSSRRNNNFNKRFSSIKTELERMKLNAVLDGEVVKLDDSGSPNFSNIITPNRKGHTVFYVFDLLWYEGRNVLDLSLVQRRKILKSILGKSELVRFSDHVEEKGIELFELVEKHRVEGIVAKHKQSVYSPGYRTNQWLKIKIGKEVEAVVAGYLFDMDKHGISSLIIGRKIDNKYKYIGLVEVGVGNLTMKKVFEATTTTRSIFSPVPIVNVKTPFRTPVKNGQIVWLNPLKCQVKYLELDRFGVMRHASFKGLL